MSLKSFKRLGNVEYEYIVYKTTNLINSKIYVGVHRTVKGVDDGYRGKGVTGKVKKGQGFIAAVAKYGYENFKRETLFSYPDTKEGRKAAYDKEAEIVTWEFIRRPDTYNLVLGGEGSHQGVNSSQVAQYDLDGNFIGVWNSIKEAADNGVAKASTISGCCQRKTYANQWQWRYFDGCTDNIAKVTPRKRPLFQYDLQGNYIATYSGIPEASAATGVDPTLISNCCTGNQGQAGNYFWTYKKEFTYVPSKLQKAVACYDKAGNFIESFDSMKDAANAYHVRDYTPISNCVRGKQKYCAGVRWRYFYGDKSPISPIA